MFDCLLNKRLIFVLLILSFAAHAQNEANAPLWLKNKIDFYQKSHPKINFQVTEYNGKVAYYIPTRCCDIPSELYDVDGHIICYPDSGFAGGDGRCPSFRRGTKSK